MQWYQRSLFRSLVDMHIPSGDGNLEQFDAEAYAQCMETAGVDTVYVAASNCLGLCLYPTKVGYRHSVSEKRDLLEERIRALRTRGIGVVAYMNSWSTEAAKRHPEWQIRSSDGKAQGESSRFGTCCLNSPYRDLIRSMVREVVSSYDIDGLWLDMVGFFASDCTCQWCREKYRAKTGWELPETINWTDPNFIRYVRFKSETVTEYASMLAAEARAIKPEISVSLQCAAWNRAMNNGFSDAYFDIMDYVSGDFYATRHKTDVICRILPNLSRNQPFEYMISCAPHLSYHTGLKNRSEFMRQACTALLCGGSFMFIDAIDPSGTLNPELYRVMGQLRRELAPFLDTVDPEAKILRDVAVYVNFDSYTVRESEGQPSFVLGTYRNIYENLEKINMAFTRAHIDYDILTEKNIHKLSQYKVLVVPDLYRMNPSECEKIAAFVKQGGRLYISGASSALSSDGTNKDRFMLSEVMGVSYREFVDVRPVYLAPTAEGASVFHGFTADYPAMVPFAVPAVEQVAEDARVLATMTYPISDARDFRRYSAAISDPPHRATNLPAVVYHPYGKGACLYSCAPVEQSTADCVVEVFNAMILSLLEEAGGLTLRCEETEYLEHVLRHNPQKRKYTVSLLNNQDVKKIVPLYEAEVSLRMEQPPRKVYTTLNEEVTWDYSEGFLHMKLRKLAIFDVIHVEY